MCNLLSGGETKKLCDPWIFPEGPKAIAGHVHGDRELEGWGSSCTSQYAPNGTRQCLMISNLWWHMSSLGLQCHDTPDWFGMAFNHKTANWTRLMVIWFGKYVKGKVAITPQHHSFTVWMRCSISSTSSLGALKLKLAMGNKGCNFSNYIFISSVCTVNPALEYSCITLLILIANCFPVLFGIHSTVVKPTPLL